MPENIEQLLAENRASESAAERIAEENEKIEIFLDFFDPDIKGIRADLEMTQEEFAAYFGFPLGSLQNWEQGRCEIPRSVKPYLLLIKRNPDFVREILGSVWKLAVPADHRIARNMAAISHMLRKFSTNFS